MKLFVRITPGKKWSALTARPIDASSNAPRMFLDSITSPWLLDLLTKYESTAIYWESVSKFVETFSKLFYNTGNASALLKIRRLLTLKYQRSCSATIAKMSWKLRDHSKDGVLFGNEIDTLTRISYIKVKRDWKDCFLWDSVEQKSWNGN